MRTRYGRGRTRVALSVVMADVLIASCFVVPAKEKSDAHALNAVFGDAFLAENGGIVLHQTAGMEPPEKYQTLAEWVLPSASHPELRLAAQFTEYRASPDRAEGAEATRYPPGGQIQSPALELIATAQQIGRLNEVRARIEAVPTDDIDGQIARSAALTLVCCADGEEVEALEHLTKLREVVSAQPAIRPEWESPLLLVLLVRTEHDGVRTAVHDLAHWLAQTELNRVELIDWRPFHRHLRALARRSVHLEPGESLTQWHGISLFTAESHGTGCPPGAWNRNGKTVDNLSGHCIDMLVFQSPLRGAFDVEYDASVFRWRDVYPSYAGYWVGVRANRRQGLVGRLFQEQGGRFTLTPHLTKFFHEVHYRISVRDRELTFFANGRRLRSVNLPADHDPWVALRASSKNSGRVWNVRVVGRPTIPHELRLSNDSQLTGWISHFDSLGEFRPPQWRSQNGMISGVRRTDLPHGAFAERLLYYYRPMLEDGAIEYEFLYEDAKTLVHPALGRLAFLLEPEGVRVHRVTNGRFDRAEWMPDNREDEPESRRGPRSLPLRDGQWNRLRLALQGDTVDLSLNGETIFRRSIEPANQRTFGLFHFADQTQALVRDVVWRGDWPKELPALYDQELVDDETESLDESAAMLSAVFHHTFDDASLSPARFRTVEGSPSEVIPTGDGLVARMKGTGRYERSGQAAQLSVGGDFDITASFDSFVTRPGEDGFSSIAIRLFFPDAVHTQANYRLRHNRFPDREDQRLLYADLAEFRNGQGRWRNFGYEPAENDSGTLRLARRGNRLYALFAEGDTQSFRITASTEVPRDDVHLRGLHLSLLTHLDSFVSVRWKELTVRAERLAGPAVDSAERQNRR